LCTIASGSHSVDGSGWGFFVEVRVQEEEVGSVSRRRRKAVGQEGQTKRENEPRNQSWSRREDVIVHPLSNKRGRAL